MNEGSWIEECSFPIKGCDKEGTLVFINARAAKNAEKAGGKGLIGKSIFPCHKPESIEKFKKLVASGATNAYTIEKNGVKSLVYQTPWIEKGEVVGFVELTIPLPENMPHYVRS